MIVNFTDTLPHAETYKGYLEFVTSLKWKSVCKLNILRPTRDC